MAAGSRIALLVIATVAAGWGIGFAGVLPEPVIIAVAGIVLFYAAGRLMARPEDRRWLAPTLAAAVVAKLAASSLRYYVLFTVYGGSGDARLYHRFGTEISDLLRVGIWPDLASIGRGSSGTRFVNLVTGLVYTPYQPTDFGGFWIFALLALGGQLLFYAAYRRAMPAEGWRRFGILILFWPTLAYWPSSIGKESTILALLGLATYGASRLFESYRVSWVVPVAAAAGVIGAIRIHVTLLLIGSLWVAIALSRQKLGAAAQGRRVVLIGGGLVALALAIGVAATTFGLSLDGSFGLDDIEPVFADIGERTNTGGSAVDEGLIRSVADVPGGVMKVLFRPLPNEADSFQTLVASMEGVLLLGLVVWRLPALVSGLRRTRRTPLAMMALTYSLGFVLVWSAIQNLGIIARQRALLLPFLFIVIAGYGWRTPITNSMDDSDHDVTVG